ncbi:MAG: branched chain amino acid aminotransferase, partial [Acetobacteraceae bacterium]|nr:branched chain amino acid aminotransferase [Acetobacteraceae bacterium]
MTATKETPISITLTRTPRPRPEDASLSFGKVFTDHMFLMNYTEGKGWHDPRVV